MRILVCAAYTPYPPAGGGRADIWRRIQAFVALGHSVMLLHQYDPRSLLAPTAEDFSDMDEVLHAHFSYPVLRGPVEVGRRLMRMWRKPWPVAKAIPVSTTRADADAAVREFRPELVWLDGPWLGDLGRAYASDFDAPMVYRSHNVEHLYLRRQAQASPRIRDKVLWRFATVGLKAYEVRLMHASSRIFDISVDDLAFWKRQGVANLRWLPPLPELAVAEPPAQSVPGDIVFVGGLRLPNNVEGVRWLLNDVLPIIHTHRSDLTVSIVGSGAAPDFAAELRQNPSVRSFFDVPSVYPYLLGAKVLVNPVAIGSGVQLKMLDMMMTDAPIVTRSQGVRGFPPECLSMVDVRDTAREFAEAILDHVNAAHVDVSDRVHSRRLFTIAAVGAAIADV